MGARGSLGRGELDSVRLDLQTHMGWRADNCNHFMPEGDLPLIKGRQTARLSGNGTLHYCRRLSPRERDC